MKRIKKIFGSCEDYKQGTMQYKNTDALLSLLLYSSLLFFYYILGVVFTSGYSILTNGFIFIGTGVMSVLIFAMLFLICLCRKQSASSVGFSAVEAKRSLKCGLVSAGCVAVIFGAAAVFSGSSVRSDVRLIILRFFYCFIEIAFVEELVFRGYIGTRLYGCFKNKTFAVCTAGALFTSMHIPFQMVMAHMTILEYISNSWVNLVSVFLMHFLFQFLYAKYNSIIAPTLFHFAWDYVQWLIV